MEGVEGKINMSGLALVWFGRTSPSRNGPIKMPHNLPFAGEGRRAD